MAGREEFASLLKAAQEGLQAGNFEVARGLGLELRERWPTRRQGYRLLIETASRSGNALEAAEILEFAVQRRVIDDQMSAQHHWQISLQLVKQGMPERAAEHFALGYKSSVVRMTHYREVMLTWLALLPAQRLVMEVALSAIVDKCYLGNFVPDVFSLKELKRLGVRCEIADTVRDFHRFRQSYLDRSEIPDREALTRYLDALGEVLETGLLGLTKGGVPGSEDPICSIEQKHADGEISSRQAVARILQSHFTNATERLDDLRRCCALAPGEKGTVEGFVRFISQVEWTVEIRDATFLALRPFRKCQNNHGSLGRIVAAMAKREATDALVPSELRLLARDLLFSAVRRQPRTEQHWVDLLNLLMGLNQLDEVAGALPKALAQVPESPRILSFDSRLQIARGNMTEGLRAAESAASTFNVAVTQRQLGAAQLAVGKYADAARSFRNAAVLAPKDLGVRRQLSTALVLLGNFVAAEDAANQQTGRPSGALEVREHPQYSSPELLVSIVTATTGETWCSVSRKPIEGATYRELLSEAASNVGALYLSTPSEASLGNQTSLLDASVVLIRQDDFEVLHRERPLTADLGGFLSIVDDRLISKWVLGGDESYAALMSTTSDVSATPREHQGLAATSRAFAILRETDLELRKLLVQGSSRRELLSEPSTLLLLHPEDVALLDEISGLDLPLALVLEKRTFLECFEDDVRRSELRRLVNAVDSICVDDLGVAERLEDEFAIAIPVAPTLEAAVLEAIRAAKKRVCVAVGAGIGNILNTTPLIRFLSEHYDAPVDVLIRSPVLEAHQLFGESSFVNKAYSQNDELNCRRYQVAFVTSSFGATPTFICARHILSQRYGYDFYPRTKGMSEVVYCFLGVDRLIESKRLPGSQELRPFVRGYVSPKKRSSRSLSNQQRIGLAGSKKDQEELWKKRQWPHFSKLVELIADAGHVPVSFGMAHEALSYCEDRTGTSLRTAIRQVETCDVFVCTDGGLFHLADVLGVETVAIFGPTSVVKNGPIVGRTQVAHSLLQCSPCQFLCEFQSCERPRCMIDISAEEVFRLVEAAVVAPASLALNTRLAEIHAHEAKMDRVPWREVFDSEKARTTAKLLECANPDWGSLVKANMGFGNYSRALQLTQWRLNTNPADSRAWRLRGRIAYLLGDEQLALDIYAHGVRDESNRSDWDDLAYACFARLKMHVETITLWESAPYRTQGPEQCSRWSDHARRVVVAYLALDRGPDARNLLNHARGLAPDHQGLSDESTALIENWYRLPETRGGGIQHSAGLLRVGVVTNHSDIFARLKEYRAGLEVYWIKPDETEERDWDLFDLIAVEDEFAVQIPARTLSWAESIGGQNWGFYSEQGLSNAATLKRWCDDLLLPANASKRVLVIAHHHLTRWDPRGGERSTLTIVEDLKEQGYEVIVLVENKKNYEAGCEIVDGISYVVVGRHALKASIESVLNCFQPDLAICYGATTLRAFPVLLERNVPYVFFPRDWQEVAASARSGMLQEAPILNPEQTHRRMMQGAAAVVTNAHYVGKVIKRLYGVDSCTSYVPVRAPQNPTTTPKSHILLINPRKVGGGALVRQLATRQPHWNFRVIGGDGLPFPPNVEVLPFQNGPYEEMYRGAAVFLFPFGLEEPCGTGRVVFEALHCLVPTVSNDVGGMNEVLPQEWLLGDSRIASWEEAIEGLLQAPPSDEYLESLLSPFLFPGPLKVVREIVEQTLRRP